MATADLVFLGTGDFAVPTLRALVDAGWVVRQVISQPDRPAGRGRRTQPTPVRAAAEELGLGHVQAVDVNDAATLAAIPEATIGVVVAFGQKLGSGLLAKFSRGCVNLHGSLLPRYRGAAPYQWAVINGDATTGVTIFQINERWDAGAVWATAETPIGATETASELHDRLAVIGAELMRASLPEIVAGTRPAAVQDAALVTRAPKLSKALGFVDWGAPAEQVARRIHGLWDWPAVACTFVGQSGRRERVLLARAAVQDASAAPSPQASPGTFLASDCVQCGAGSVRLLEIKPEGGKLMPFTAFANGRGVRAGDRLESPAI